MLRIIGSQWGNILLRILSALALTPFLIGALGAEGYGVWIFLNAVVGYLSIIQSGIPAASLRHLSEELVEHGYEGFNKTVASAMVLFCSVAGIVVLAAIALLMLTNTASFVPDQWLSDGRVAFILATMAIATTLICNPVMTILEAHGSYLPRNLIEMGGTLLRTGLTVGLVLWTPSLTMVGVATFCAELFILLAMIVFSRIKFPAVRLGFKDCDASIIWSLFSFSLVVFLLALGVRVAYKTDALVIGMALPMAAVSVYSVANTLALYLSRLISGVAEPLMPQATRLRREGKDAELEILFLKWSKVSMSIALLIGLFLTVMGPAFVSLWINPEFGEQVRLVLRILVFSFVISLPVSAVGFRFLLGLTRPIGLAITYFVAGLVNLGLSLALVKSYGLPGVAFGTAAPNILLAGVILVLCCKEVGVTVARYCGYVMLKPYLAAIPVCGLLLVMERHLPVETFIGFVGAGVVYVFTFLLLWVLVVYRDDPYLDLRARLSKFVR